MQLSEYHFITTKTSPDDGPLLAQENFFVVGQTWFVEQWRAEVVFRGYAPLQSYKCNFSTVRGKCFVYVTVGEELITVHWQDITIIISLNLMKFQTPFVFDKPFSAETGTFLKSLIQSKYCVSIDSGDTWIFSS